MAFTRGWDSATPAGTRNANEIDNAIREHKVDFEERVVAKLFNSLPNTTVEADLVVRPEILGNETARQIVYPGFVLNPRFITTINSVQLATDAFGILHIPNGVSVVLFELLADRVLSGPITAVLYRVEFSAAATVTDLASVTRTASSPGISSVGVSHTANNKTGYYAVRTSATSIIGIYSVFGFRITFDKPDSRSAY